MSGREREQQRYTRESTLTQAGTVDYGEIDTDDRSAATMRGEREITLLPSDRMSNLNEEWTDVQASFVDDPRSAVKRAHKLVGELVDELTRTFSQERASLEERWNRGEEADTEALRVALQRYRSFFNRLLAA